MGQKLAAISEFNSFFLFWLKNMSEILLFYTDSNSLFTVGFNLLGRERDVSQGTFVRI